MHFLFLFPHPLSMQRSTYIRPKGIKIRGSQDPKEEAPFQESWRSLRKLKLLKGFLYILFIWITMNHNLVWIYSMLCKFKLPVFKFNLCTLLLFNLTCLEKAREFQKYTSISASFTMLKPLTVWITTNCGIFLNRLETRSLYLSPEKLAFRTRSNN